MRKLQLLLNIKIAIRLKPLLYILTVPFEPMSLGLDGVQTLANSSVEALSPKLVRMSFDQDRERITLVSLGAKKASTSLS